jgi:hypothetical protein
MSAELKPCPGVDTRADDYCAWKTEWDKGHPYAPAEGDAFDAGYRAAWTRASGMQGMEAPGVPDASEVRRVLGYLQSDETEIRAAKDHLIWADTMARASDLIRTLAAATSPNEGGSA